MIEAPRKILITGGAGETGRVFTQKIAQRSYFPIVTVSEKPNNKLSAEKRAIEFQKSIRKATSVCPKVVRVDLSKITVEEQAAEFVDSLELEPEEPIHYAALAAGGLPFTTIGKEYVRTRGAYDSKNLTEADLRRSTDVIRSKIEQDEGIRNSALELNFTSPKLIKEELIRRGHIGSLSVVITLSSIFSDDFRLDRPQLFQGPAFYFYMANTKKSIAETLREQVYVQEFKYLDFVAPEIRDTSVGKYFEDFAKFINFVHPDQPPAGMPSVTKEVVAEMLVSQLEEVSLRNQRFARVYLNSDGSVSNVRPVGWPTQPLRGYF
ncbi:MAG: hypothetical protein Q8P92_04150 [Candidatus Daviesbacteria bacterium]|nr:hypothetical protein [Candidatus Daviesbacteria bacterium]